jgi:hypothetical protein
MMKATIIQTIFGVLAFDEGNRLLAHSLFQKKPEEAAKTILEMESGKVVKEVADLIGYLKNSGYEVFAFENPFWRRALKRSLLFPRKFQGFRGWTAFTLQRGRLRHRNRLCQGL